MIAESRIRNAFFALGLVALIWGYNWVVMKVALDHSGPMDFSLLRNFFGAVTLFIVIAMRRDPLRLPPAPGKVLLLGLMQTTGFVGLIAIALTDGGAGKSAVLAYTMPFWALLFGAWFLHEKVRGLQWLAVGLAAAGVVFLVAPWEPGYANVSSLTSLLAGLVWGASIIVAKRIPQDEPGALLSITAWQMLLGSVPLALLAWLVPEQDIEWTSGFIIALAYNAVLGSALAWMLWLYAVRILPAGTAGLASLGAPAVSVLTAWLQLHEVPTPFDAAGMLLIFAALAVLTLRALHGRRDRL
ncbi:MAG TPA: DMT family transporter [Gammaproteobacteria bacterium]